MRKPCISLHPFQLRDEVILPCTSFVQSTKYQLLKLVRETSVIDLNRKLILDLVAICCLGKKDMLY